MPNHTLHLLDAKYMVTCITFSFGSIGLVNAGRNNIGNIIGKNLENYKILLKDQKKAHHHDRLIKRIRNDLYFYSQTSFFLKVCLITSMVQIGVTVYTNLIEKHLMEFSNIENSCLVEGFMFCLSVVGILISITGIMLVMTNSRQNPFKGGWSLT